MREAALSLLPNDKMVLDKLYNDLKRGKDILDDEIHLNMYLRSFGKMHKAKLDEAFTVVIGSTSAMKKKTVRKPVIIFFTFFMTCAPPFFFSLLY